MSTLVSPLHVPASAQPAGSPSLLRRMGTSLLRGLETVGRVRAANEMGRLACYYEGVNPELARRMREIARYHDAQA